MILYDKIKIRGLTGGCHDLRDSEKHCLSCEEWIQFDEAYHWWNGDPENTGVEPIVLPDFAVIAFIDHLLRVEYGYTIKI